MVHFLKTRNALLVLAFALIAGFVSAKFMAQGNPLVTIPWGVLAFLCPFIAHSRREALTLGGLLGFVASYAYLWFDHTGALNPASVAVLIPLIALPSFFGCLAGTVCAWVGWLANSRL